MCHKKALTAIHSSKLCISSSHFNRHNSSTSPPTNHCAALITSHCSAANANQLIKRCPMKCSCFSHRDDSDRATAASSVSLFKPPSSVLPFHNKQKLFRYHSSMFLSIDFVIIIVIIFGELDNAPYEAYLSYIRRRGWSSLMVTQPSTSHHYYYYYVVCAVCKCVYCFVWYLL